MFRCKLCRFGDKILPRIEADKQRLKHSTAYNQYLFELFLQFIKRYRITLSDLTTSHALTKFLIKSGGPNFSWKDVKQTSDKFRQFIKSNTPFKRGDPFVKIGRRLSELGVIPYIDRDEQTKISRQLQKFPSNVAPFIQLYSDYY